MALTIEMPPQMAEEARGYAVLEDMTLEALVIRSMRNELSRCREQASRPKSFAERWRSAVCKSSGRLPAPYKFNRADAYPEGEFAVQIKAQYGLQFFDSLLLAAAEANGCDTILTEDLNDGQIYNGVRAVNPFLKEVAG